MFGRNVVAGQLQASTCIPRGKTDFLTRQQELKTSFTIFVIEHHRVSDHSATDINTKQFLQGLSLEEELNINMVLINLYPKYGTGTLQLCITRHFPQVTGLTCDYTQSETTPDNLLLKASRYYNFLFPDRWWWDQHGVRTSPEQQHVFKTT